MNLSFQSSNSPKNTFIFENLLKSYTAENIGFTKPRDFVYRFINRFRLAKEFKEIKFDTYSTETTTGYSSLFRIFLAYSAFELFLQIIGKNKETVFNLIEPYNPLRKINFILTEDNNKLLFLFLYDHLSIENQKLKLKAIYDGESSNIIYIASSIRHIFAHGYLSSYPNGIKSQNIKNISDCLFDFLINFMDDEFSKRVKTFYESTK